MASKPKTPSSAITVAVGQWQLAPSAYGVLRTERVSAGLVLVVHYSGPDEGDALGALAHVQMPKSSAQTAGNTSVLTVEDALEAMEAAILEEAKAKEFPVASISEMQVFIVGGAQLFAFGGGHNALNIGSRNVDAAHRWLQSHHALVSAEAVGGNRARNVEYHVGDGQVWATPLGGEDELLQG